MTALRERLRHFPATQGTVYEDDRLLGMVYSSEEFVSSPLIDTSSWTTAAQNGFDIAVLEMIQLWIVNPDYAKRTEDNEQQREYFDQVPYAVKVFWENYADGKVPGSKNNKPFVLGRFVRG